MQGEPQLEEYQRIDGQKAFMLVFMLAALDTSQFIFGLTIMGEFFWLGPGAPLLASIASIPFSAMSVLMLWISLKTSNVGIMSSVHAGQRRLVMRMLLFAFESFLGPFFPGWPLIGFYIFWASRKEDKKQFENALDEFKNTGEVVEFLPLKNN